MRYKHLFLAAAKTTTFYFSIMPMGAWTVDLGINGSYNTSHSTYEATVRKSVGLDLSVPMGRFFELNLYHGLFYDRTVYNNLYRELILSKGYILPPGVLDQTTSSTKTSINGALGMVWGIVRPMIFGGGLWKTSCMEDTFQDQGCTVDPLTWNAGLGLGIHMTQWLRVKASYRVSPSILKKILDEDIIVGIGVSL